jgi:transmembrane sensor
MINRPGPLNRQTGKKEKQVTKKMKKNKEMSNRSKREGQKRLQTFREVTERYLKGQKLREGELQIINEFVRLEQEEPEETDVLDILEISENVWTSIEKEISKGNDTKERPKRIARRLHLSYQAVAAMLILVIGIGSLISWLIQRQDTTLDIQYMADSKVKTIQLPDSTVVYLNVESTLSYNPKRFNTDKRRVDLVGEAFFEVKKNPEKPFLVYGGELITTVRGTSFDVKVYPEIKDNVVSVRDGVVEVFEREKGQLLATLVHNRQVCWDTEKNSGRTNRLNWEEAGGWIDGKTMVLNSAGLNEIILKVRRYYGLELTVRSFANQSIRLRGSFPANDQGKALIRQMCDIYGLKCDSDSRAGQIKLYR